MLPTNAAHTRRESVRLVLQLVAAAAVMLVVLNGRGSAQGLLSDDLIVVDSEAPLYNGTVFRVNRSTGAQSVLSTGGLFGEPMRAAITAQGEMLIVDSGPYPPGHGKVIRVDVATGAQSEVASDGLLTFPQGLAIEPDGNILVANSKIDATVIPMVIRVSQGGVQTIVSSGGFLVSPTSIAVGQNGQVFVGDRSGIVRVDRFTGAQTIVSPGNRPYDIALEATGQGMSR